MIRAGADLDYQTLFRPERATIKRVINGRLNRSGKFPVPSAVTIAPARCCSEQRASPRLEQKSETESFELSSTVSSWQRRLAYKKVSWLCGDGKCTLVGE